MWDGDFGVWAAFFLGDFRLFWEGEGGNGVGGGVGRGVAIAGLIMGLIMSWVLDG